MGRTAVVGTLMGRIPTYEDSVLPFVPSVCIYLTISCFLVSKFQYIQKQVRKRKDSEKTPISPTVSEQKIAAVNPGKFLGYLWTLIIILPSQVHKSKLLGRFTLFGNPSQADWARHYWDFRGEKESQNTKMTPELTSHAASLLMVSRLQASASPSPWSGPASPGTC